MASYKFKSNIDEDLQTQIAFNELILQSIGEGVCVVDQEKKISFANAAAVKMLGLNLEEILSQDYQKIFFKNNKDNSSTDYSEEFSPIQFALAEGEPIQVNYEIFYRGDGSGFIAEYSCVPLLKDEKIVGVVVTFQDISERCDLEKAVSQSRDKALEIAQEKANFLANMSHEIRTPLNGIIGISELLAETNLSIGQKDYIETLKSSANLLLNIVNDILDFSKIEAGKLQLEENDFNLYEITIKTIKLFKPQAIKKQIKLDFEIQEGIPTDLCGDSGRLRQVLNNLIGNAVKFTENGDVFLKISSKKENLLRFEVSDTGIGIEKSKQSQIFEPFAQADASTTRQFGGTGLGLAISKQIVQMMDGEIGVESELNKGSKFWFTAYFKSPSVLESNNNVSEKPVDNHLNKLNKLNVLVVDDNPVNLEVALGKLNKFGIKTEGVENGFKAIEAVQEKKYDLILMDCRMPKMDGFETTRQIRDLNGEEKNIKIVAMTASVENDERQRCFEVGMNDYLTKPLSDETLIQIIEKHLLFSLPNDLKSDITDINQHQLAEIIDKKTLQGFIEIEKHGEKDFAREMLNIYINHVETQLPEMQNGFDVRDLNLVKNKSHLLRGSSGNIGLLDLYQEFIHLEEKVENDWFEAEIIFKRIQEKFNKLKIKISYLSEIGD